MLNKYICSYLFHSKSHFIRVAVSARLIWIINNKKMDFHGRLVVIWAAVLNNSLSESITNARYTVHDFQSHKITVLLTTQLFEVS